MTNKIIGQNAGKLWELLDKQDVLSFKDAKKKLKLTIPNMHLAMGWLSREEKLLIEEKKEDLFLSLVK